MDKDDLKEYMQIQVAAVKLYKWMGSEKAGRNLGNEASNEWAEKFGQIYSKRFETISPMTVRTLDNNTALKEVYCYTCIAEHRKLLIAAILEIFAEVFTKSSYAPSDFNREDWLEHMKQTPGKYQELIDSTSRDIAQHLNSKDDLNGLRCLGCDENRLQSFTAKILDVFLDIISETK